MSSLLLALALVGQLGGRPSTDGTDAFYGGTLGTTTTFLDDTQLQFGTGNDTKCEYDTAVTPDAMVCGLGSDSRVYYVCEAADLGTDWALAQQTNPTLCVQSADATTVTDRVCLAHDQTDAVIFSSGGDIKVDPAGTMLYLANAAGPMLEDAASSTTNPTVVPDRASATAGMGGTGGDVELITNGASRVNIDTGGDITVNSTSMFITRILQTRDGSGGATGGVQTFGTSDDFRLMYSTTQTPDSMLYAVSSDSRAIVFTEVADMTVDFAHALQTNPTLFIQSADGATIADYLSLAHDQTNSVVGSGSGTVTFPQGFAGTENAVTGADSLVVADCGRWTSVTVGIDTNQIVLPDVTGVPAGCTFRIQYTGASAGALLDISPLDSTADGIYGSCDSGAAIVTFSGTDDADIGLVKATSIKGDWIDLVSDGVNGFYVHGCMGVWANN